MKCSTCGVETANYNLCDVDNGDRVWCDRCFERTPCGRGRHGEGCPTRVFDDAKENDDEAQAKAE